MMMAGGGGYGMESAVIGPVVAPEPTIEEQINQAEVFLEFLEGLWEDEEIRDAFTQDKWDEFIESVEGRIDELEESL